jgi:hypothetical protein
MHAHLLAEAAARHLPTKPVVFGVFTFAILGLLLYVAMRQEQD